MTTNVLLFVGDRNCRVAFWKNGFLHSQMAFPNNEEGRRQYAHYLDAMKKPTVSILADLVEEDYRLESVPSLRGRDRSLFYARKLEQYYRYTPLRNALFQEKEGKNDHVLFSALTSPNLLLPWIAFMDKRRVAVSSVCSVAMLSRRFIGKIPSSHILLFSFQDMGLRQSFFLNGKLNFSRLTLLHPGDDLAAVVQIESDRIFKYLHTLNLIPEHGALLVCILCGIEERKSLGQVLEDTDSVHHVYFDLKEAAARIGFRGALEGSDALPLFLHLLAREPGANQYGSEEHTHRYDLRQWQRFASALSAALILTGSIWAGIDIVKAFSLHSQSRLLAARTDAVMIQYSKLVPSDSGSASPQKMKAAVKLFDKISSAIPKPGLIMSEVSQALDAYPDVRIDKLSWLAAKNPELVKSANGEVKGGRDVFEPGPLYLTVFIEGDIFPFDGNYRHANETVDSFCAELGKIGMTVTKITLPLDLNPEMPFTGKSGQVEGRAAFSLKAFWKVTP